MSFTRSQDTVHASAENSSAEAPRRFTRRPAEQDAARVNAESMEGLLPFPRTPRMAVFGGSFDPIHNGHIQIASYILRSGLANEVLFVPALQPPHKVDQELESAEHRMAMVRLALEECGAPLLEELKAEAEKKAAEEAARQAERAAAKAAAEAAGEEYFEPRDQAKNQEAPSPVSFEHYGFSFSDMELCRTGMNSYTYDTMSILKKIYPDNRLAFVMGMDSLCQLDKWYRATELVQMVDFIIYPRPGVKPPNYVDLAATFGARNAKRLLDSVIPEGQILQSEVSSTRIRSGIARGEDMSGMLPASVWAYILENGLYR